MKMMALRVAEESKASWEAAAKRAGVPLSGWIRSVLDRESGSSEAVKVMREADGADSREFLPEPIVAKTPSWPLRMCFRCARNVRIGLEPVPGCSDCAVKNE